MAGTQEMVIVDSRFPYAETVKRLKAAIQAKGMRVMFVDDQQATLRKAGVKSPGAVVIEFFNTEYTKRVFEIDHAAHMAIPLRVGVMEGGEHDPHSKTTHVMYDRPSAIFARYQGLGTLASELDRVLEAIVASVAAEGGMQMDGHAGRPRPGLTGGRAIGAPERVTLKLEGLTASGCSSPAAVKGTMTSIEGVSAAEVRLERGEAVIEVDRAKVDLAQLAAKVERYCQVKVLPETR
jgi:uncharacterized protein (DUF302 family)/copper chaperone CopZ